MKNNKKIILLFGIVTFFLLVFKNISLEANTSPVQEQQPQLQQPQPPTETSATQVPAPQPALGNPTPGNPSPKMFKGVPIKPNMKADTFGSVQDDDSNTIFNYVQKIAAIMDLRNSIITNPRKANSEIKFPEYSIDAEVAKIKSQMASIPKQEFLDKVEDLCIKTANKHYTDFAKKEYKVLDLENYFDGVCSALIKNLVNEKSNVKVYSNNFGDVIKNNLDNKLVLFHTSAAKIAVSKVDEMARVYKSSLFGMAGVPMKYSDLILQVGMLVSLLLSLVAFLKS